MKTLKKQQTDKVEPGTVNTTEVKKFSAERLFSEKTQQLMKDFETADFYAYRYAEKSGNKGKHYDDKVLAKKALVKGTTGFVPTKEEGTAFKNFALYASLGHHDRESHWKDESAEIKRIQDFADIMETLSTI